MSNCIDIPTNSPMMYAAQFISLSLIQFNTVELSTCGKRQYNFLHRWKLCHKYLECDAQQTCKFLWWELNHLVWNSPRRMSLDELYMGYTYADYITTAYGWVVVKGWDPHEIWFNTVLFDLNFSLWYFAVCQL